MDKLYLDTANKNISLELPKFGTLKIIVQDGKVVRTETTITQKVQEK